MVSMCAGVCVWVLTVCERVCGGVLGCVCVCDGVASVRRVSEHLQWVCLTENPVATVAGK